MSKSIGILTAGGDTPGLNAALRGIGKAIQEKYPMHLIGFKDGFRGLAENRYIRLDKDILSGILTVGGTILGTSREKPHRMQVGNKVLDMTDAIIENYNQHRLEALVCIGGGGTLKSAFRLHQKGLNIISLPKTIDNDIGGTDISLGFDTALGVATEAIDRLHSTAHSHHRIIVVEVMGHRAGWLALGAGMAGGADVILIPEIPYQTEQIAKAIVHRQKSGKPFSIVAAAEGAMSVQDAEALHLAELAKSDAESKEGKKEANLRIEQIYKEHQNNIMKLSADLEIRTGLESRVSILGYVQRGGTPSAADRMLATRLGTACAEQVNRHEFGVMLAVKGDDIVPIPIGEAAGKRKVVPPDHPWIQSAKTIGTCFGD